MINFNSYVGCFHVSLNSLPLTNGAETNEFVDDKSFNHEKLCSTFSHDLTLCYMSLSFTLSSQFYIKYLFQTSESKVHTFKCRVKLLESKSESELFFYYSSSFILPCRNLIYRSSRTFHASTLTWTFNYIFSISHYHLKERQIK